MDLTSSIKGDGPLDSSSVGSIRVIIYPHPTIVTHSVPRSDVSSPTSETGLGRVILGVTPEVSKGRPVSPGVGGSHCSYSVTNRLANSVSVVRSSVSPWFDSGAVSL